MDLIPLADRVLIRPDPVATQTTGGLHIVEDWPDEVSGIVVSCGRSRHPRKEEAFVLAEWLDEYADKWTDTLSQLEMEHSAQLLRDLTGREPAVAIGDRVLFTRASGQEVTIDDTRYFLMREQDLLAVLEGADA